MASPACTLYTYPLAYNPFKASLVLEEKGIKYKAVRIDLFNGQSLSPAFLKINPSGTVPTLVVDEGKETITDSSAIVAYVNGLAPGPLGGSDADQKAAEAWVQRLKHWDGNLFIAANSDPGAAKVLRPLQTFKVRYAEARMKEQPELAAAYASKIKAMKADMDGPTTAAADANRTELVGLLDDAEQQLSRSPYLAGNAYSVADVLFTPVLFRLGMAGKTGEYLKPRPHTSAYYNRMKERPSFSKVFGPAGQKLTLATLLLPALAKAQIASLTGWY